MRYAVAGTGFIAFTAVSLLHFNSLYRIAVIHRPDLQVITVLVAVLLWLLFLSLVARGMYRSRLRLPCGVVFGYAMVIALGGMRVLDGVPAAIGEGQWHDPHHQLRPEAKYLLHNHGVVKKALSKEEYDLYSWYGLAYFSGVGMVFCMAASLLPLDRNGQLVQRRQLTNWTAINKLQVAQRVTRTFRCPGCRGAIPVEEDEKLPPWCPRCGADL
jgi:hypothetical protein